MQKTNLPVIYQPQKCSLAARSYCQYFTPFGLFITILLILGYVLFFYATLKGHIADEVFHARMVDRILEGQWNNLPTDVTTPPLIHIILAGFYKISGATGHELEVMRLGQFLLSLGAIPCFFYIATQLKESNSDLRCLLCLLLPIYLPLFDLVYTDPPSITCAMLMVLFSIKKNYWLAGGIALIGVGMRQMNIIWACFCCFYILFQYLSTENIPLSKWIKPINYKLHWKFFLKILPFTLPAIFFVSYSLYNGNVVSGDQQAHQVSLNLSNLFSFLIASFFLFLPYHVENTQKILALLRKYKSIIACIIFVFFIYLWQHKITHNYNNPSMGWWLHNKIMIYSTLDPILKILFFIPVAWAGTSHFIIARDSKYPWRLYLVYTFGLLTFLPLPLVELRYYIITFLLFILFKPQSKLGTEQAQLIIFVITSMYMIYATSQRLIFI